MPSRQMIDANLRVEVQGFYILVAMRGTCFRAKYRKQDAPWLALDEYAGDAEAAITFNEFRTLAWEAANEKARSLGWVKSCEDRLFGDPGTSSPTKTGC